MAEDDEDPHRLTTCRAQRSRNAAICAALACHMANESYFRKAIVSWDDSAKTMKS
jgi:hypothetical protein